MTARPLSRRLLPWLVAALALAAPAGPGRADGQTAALAPAEAERAVAGRAREAMAALRGKGLRRFSSFVHPTQGVRFSPSAYVDAGHDLRFTARHVSTFFSDTTRYTWGLADGTGEPIQLTFAEFYRRHLNDRDYSSAPQVSYNRTLGRGNTVNNATAVYPGAVIVEYYFPGTDPNFGGLDWESLRLVFQRQGTAWYIVGIIKDHWTI